MSNIKTYDWLSLNEAFMKENEARLSRNKDQYCTFGITPLDDAFLAILPDELIVIGADSGAGKTELALQIARHNLLKKKKVVLYHLEGGWQEAIARMKWRDIADEYFKKYKEHGEFLDYRTWVLNQQQGILLGDIENSIWERYKAEYKDNLMLYSSKEGLTIDTFFSSLLDFHRLDPAKRWDEEGVFDIDLIIIDHLQYFSLVKAESEINEITQILKEVKNITENYKIPVVLISHLRKKTKDRGLPDQEDFYGTSNIPKISTASIVLSPASQGDDFCKGVFPTWIRVVKSRIGLRPNYAFLVNFNQTTRAYDDTYKIYKIDQHGNVAKDGLLKTECPHWAKGAIDGRILEKKD